MPTYTYACQNGHRFEQFFSLANHCSTLGCTHCDALAHTVITAPIMVTAQPECRYDSPIDGTVIDSWAKRRNDLAKHNCQEYDPEMKTDALNRVKDKERTLDKQVDETVERIFEKMPTKQRGRLASEVVEQGVGLTFERKQGVSHV